MSDVKPDFFSINLLLDDNLLKELSKIPHELSDAFGNCISSSGSSTLSTEDVLLLGEAIVGKIRFPENQRSVLPILQAHLHREYEHLVEGQANLHKEIIAEDMESILELSEHEDVPLEKILLHFLKILRAHLLVDEAGFFGMYDGFSLEGLVSLLPGGEQSDKWKAKYSSAAGFVATTKNHFECSDPKADKNFPEKENVPKNFYGLPLLHGETLVGVLYLANKMSGIYTDSDKKILERFERVGSHILQKHFFKKRVESLAKTSDHLGKYLSSKVVKNVKKTDSTELGGVEKKVVCLFSDIRSFTTITEGIEARTLVKLLNFYFEQMSPIIDRYEGTLDKIVGDLIMAVWNIPHDQPEPELLAMKCAIDMQKEMIRIVAPEWGRHNVNKVGMGIGVNAGLAVAGNLGSSRFMNYTVVGDTINTAQRLEARARAGEIWMAESLFPAVDGKIEKPLRRENHIKLKGKDNTVHAYVYKPLSY